MTDYNDDYCLFTIIFYGAGAHLEGKMFCEDDLHIVPYINTTTEQSLGYR